MFNGYYYHDETGKFKAAEAHLTAISQEALELLSGLDRENAYLTQLIRELIHRKK